MREKTKAECVNCPNDIIFTFTTKNGIAEKYDKFLYKFGVFS